MRRWHTSCTASGEHGGFVQLSGEVGTGKTSVCRCLLEQLPPHVDAALVLNPRLSPVELLATVCDELQIPYAKGTAGPKELVDQLHRHLLDAHGRGRRTVLVIDEAQNLAPEVLEEVRLLTNLETPREKLLQIVLIGQPELVALLAQPKLRQLAQRITARYHLEPLSRVETRAYVRHRLRVAGRGDAVFTELAMRAMYRTSRGVPRLINVIADRALLGAYTRDRARVDAQTVRQAATEVKGHPGGRWRRWGGRVAAAVLVAALGGAGLLLLAPDELGRSESRRDDFATESTGPPTVSAPSTVSTPPAVSTPPVASPLPAVSASPVASPPPTVSPPPTGEPTSGSARAPR